MQHGEILGRHRQLAAPDVTTMIISLGRAAWKQMLQLRGLMQDPAVVSSMFAASHTH